jgi:CBS domain containing-hemolysin-like protein
MLTLPIILFVLFLGLSAFFSSSETAITSISKLHVEKLLEGGRKDSPRSLWLKDPNRILATLLVGNNIANVGASIIAAYIAGQVFPEDKKLAGFVAFTGTTGALLIFGEIIPKILAKMHFEAIAPRVIRPLNFLYVPFAPVIWVCLSLSNLVIRFLGGGPGGRRAGDDSQHHRIRRYDRQGGDGPPDRHDSPAGQRQPEGKPAGNGGCGAFSSSRLRGANR